MKVDQSSRAKLAEYAKEKDWSSYHILYDEIIKVRLEELDPEFIADLERIENENDARFWFS